ncbi:MAG: membrane protein insertion efficiency factor YidD [Candidatus Pacebacteria bacterium]|nr:membrane protein insertion efficiency factor YidD [Candidatus Paceibacterota bacterium]
MFSRIILKIIRAYQLFLSPFFGGHCRFYPSCSEYCHSAVEKHGALRGLALAGRRIMKCNPFSPGGIDYP